MLLKLRLHGYVSLEVSYDRLTEAAPETSAEHAEWPKMTRKKKKTSPDVVHLHVEHEIKLLAAAAPIVNLKTY